jgi:hypothetical protein
MHDVVAITTTITCVMHSRTAQGTTTSASVPVTVSLSDPNGTVVATATLPSPPVAAGGAEDVVFESIDIYGNWSGGTVTHPIALWTLDSPMMYRCAVTPPPICAHAHAHAFESALQSCCDTSLMSKAWPLARHSRTNSYTTPITRSAPRPLSAAAHPTP